jgi:hypothetical protein
MSHSVSETAARAVANSQRKVEEKRTPEQILKGIRGNLAAHLAVTPNDTAFLLSQYDAAEGQYQAAVKIITERNHEVDRLRAVGEFGD